MNCMELISPPGLTAGVLVVLIQGPERAPVPSVLMIAVLMIAVRQLSL